METGNILVVEDDPDIRGLMVFTLQREGYRVSTCANGLQVQSQISQHQPDLIILDVMLPGIDGFEVCRRIRQETVTQTLPVIMVTARSEDADIITGLENGAQDYMTKPFSPKVLLARIKAQLRRVRGLESEGPPVVRAGPLVLDPGRHAVTFEGRPVDLSATEFAILRHLASYPGQVFSRAKIIDAIRGDNYPVTDRSVDVQILSLRKKLGPGGDLIETVRGVGYRLAEEIR